MPTASVTNTFSNGTNADALKVNQNFSDLVTFINTSILGNGVLPVRTLDIDATTDIGGALADADLIIVDDGGGGTNRKSELSRVATYLFAKVSGDVTATSGGAVSIGTGKVTSTHILDGTIVNADVNASAAIAYSKLNLAASVKNSDLSTTAGEVGGDWLAWTPALTASVSNPTLGSGSAATGHYTRIGKTILARGSIQFGTSGTAAGSGTYYVSLPVTADDAAATTFVLGGNIRLSQSAGGALRVWANPLLVAGGTKFQIRWVATPAGSAESDATHAVPWAWTASDRIEFFVQYESV